mgnify:CR=1 FL=1
MMNEDWLNKVRDRMTDYETDEPENLWASIESKTCTQVPASTGAKRRMLLLKARLRPIAAAAMLVMAVAAGIYMLMSTPGLTDTPVSLAVSDDMVTEPQETVSPLMADARMTVTSEPYAGNIRRTERSKDAAHKEIPADDTENVPDEPSRAEPETEPETGTDASLRTVPETTEESAAAGGRTDVHRRSDFTHDIAPLRHSSAREHRISVSVFSSGGTGSMQNSNRKSPAFVNSTGPDNSNWADSPKLGILVFNQGKDVSTDIRHRLPIRAGVSFAYGLTDRLGLESGLTYTGLTSDIREGSESHYCTGVQKLHYIGVPLNVKYRLISWRMLDLYGSAGALAEKCVSARVDTDYILDGRKTASDTESLSEHPLQWSVNASLGVQCRLISALSLYVEPGVSYYFDDGSSLNIIYKDKPVNFNLNLGLRFTFGK